MLNVFTSFSKKQSIITKQSHNNRWCLKQKLPTLKEASHSVFPSEREPTPSWCPLLGHPMNFPCLIFSIENERKKELLITRHRWFRWFLHAYTSSPLHHHEKSHPCIICSELHFSRNETSLYFSSFPHIKNQKILSTHSVSWAPLHERWPLLLCFTAQVSCALSTRKDV